MMIRFVSFVVIALLASCSSKEDRHAAGGKNASETFVPSQTAITQATVYACPMHPEVTSDKAGTCSVCGMNLALQAGDTSDTHGGLSPEQRIVKAKRELHMATSELVREGSYRCCIQEPCLECALAHQSCTCFHDLRAGKPVCPECYGGWQRGEGREKNINPKDVKVSYSDHKH
jgi:hypothetical protein